MIDDDNSGSADEEQEVITGMVEPSLIQWHKTLDMWLQFSSSRSIKQYIEDASYMNFEVVAN